MLDEFKEEQKIVYTILKNSVKKNHSSHAYLFETNGYSKYEQLVISFAKYLFCESYQTNLNYCTKCTQCYKIDHGIFSELKIIKPDRMWIKKEQMDELQREFMQTSIQSELRVYIIFEADKMNVNAANSILKFLEEPENNIIAILVTDNIYQLLDTIVSRCQIVSLAKNVNLTQLDLIDKIKAILSLSNEIEKVELDKYIQTVIQFIATYEKKGKNILLYTQKLWHIIFNDQEKIKISMEIMILYYKDILNYKLNKKIEIFCNDINAIASIASMMSIEKIIKKIHVIYKSKENIKINMNNYLLLDQMILNMEDGE